MPKSQADPSNLWILEGIDREFKFLSLVCFGRVDMRNASLRKKLTDHSSSPCSMKGREGWPGHGLCTLWLGELFTFQHILCAFVPHCTSTEEWALSRIKYLEVSGFFASSHDISGDRPASASMRVRAPGEPGKKEF